MSPRDSDAKNGYKIPVRGHHSSTNHICHPQFFPVSVRFSRCHFPNIALLTQDIERFLGYDNVNRAVLVGAGHMGSALLSYRGFSEFGLEIVAAFDNSPSAIGKSIGGKTVLPVEKLPGLCRRLNAHIGIITVPSASAQDACNALVAGGVLAIWNFASAHLLVPEGILVHHENMAASLAALSQYLREAMREN